MKYQCKICGFETDLKSQINIHHITPRECGGKNNKWNLVELCPSCHSCVYNPTSKHGIHSKKGIKSFEILCWRKSTSGLLLECKNIQTNEIYYV